MKKLLVLGMLCTPFMANAVTINVNQTTCSNSGAYTNANCAALTQEIKDTIEGDLPTVSVDKYATGVANSTDFAYKGLTSDYSDNFNLISVRAAAGGAIQGEMSDPEQAEGVSVGASVTVGLNLDVLPIDKIGFVDFEKLDVFASFMSHELKDQELSEDTNGDLEISNFAIMARYQFMDSKTIVPGYMLEWGGLHLHTGFQRSTFKGTISRLFDNQTVDLSGGQSATIQDTNVNFEVDSAVTSIPVEISTYLRAAYVFTFFGGAGFDFVTGSTDVNLKGQGTASQGSDYAATITASEDQSGDVDPTNFRVFGGLQFNIPFVRVVVQANKGLGNDLLGANVGIKVLW